jgi:hypothetical protein
VLKIVCFIPRAEAGSKRPENMAAIAADAGRAGEKIGLASMALEKVRGTARRRT